IWRRCGHAGRHGASVPRRRSWDQGRLPPTSPPRSIGLRPNAADAQAGAGPRAPPSRRRCSDEPSRAASGDPPPACAANRRGCSSSTMAIARMRRACLASAVRAASARNCEILRSWRVISIADMLPAPRINDMLHRVTFATAWESPTSQVLGRLVLVPVPALNPKPGYVLALVLVLVLAPGLGAD